ncbi:hypothetical protein [Microbacterium arborescens]|uniref:hypothetical protein n=1 Tax=Microbacterium arborescens TaxID=33883 RepID=UPI0027D8E981|nr:hypothetical protein [Microbacterium arborescens]
MARCATSCRGPSTWPQGSRPPCPPRGHCRKSSPRRSSTATPAYRCARARAARSSSVCPATPSTAPPDSSCAGSRCRPSRRTGCTRPAPENIAQPEVEFGKGDAQWWRLPRYDSALVSAADGSGKNIYTRDRAAFRRMLRESVRLHAQLKRDWPKLSRRYRRAMGQLTSPESWERIFDPSGR